MSERLFIGVYPAGIVYADRTRECGGDYQRLAFLAYDTLHLSIRSSCPEALRPEIEAHAATIQARRGEIFEVSTAGQTIRLGGAP
jgi:hypothetical protein